MSKIIEEWIAEEKIKVRMMIASRVLSDGTLTNEQIARYTDLPIEKIEELAAQLASTNA